MENDQEGSLTRSHTLKIKNKIKTKVCSLLILLSHIIISIAVQVYIKRHCKASRKNSKASEYANISLREKLSMCTYWRVDYMVGPYNNQVFISKSMQFADPERMDKECKLSLLCRLSTIPWVNGTYLHLLICLHWCELIF